jgi:hypothetical protein
VFYADIFVVENSALDSYVAIKDATVSGVNDLLASFGHSDPADEILKGFDLFHRFLA